MKILISCSAKLKPTHILWPAANLFHTFSGNDYNWVDVETLTACTLSFLGSSPSLCPICQGRRSQDCPCVNESVRIRLQTILQAVAVLTKSLGSCVCGAEQQ